jgi:hypothetical protein
MEVKEEETNLSFSRGIVQVAQGQQWLSAGQSGEASASSRRRFRL